MKKIILAAFILIPFSSPAFAACEGFLNSMNALEAAVKEQPKPQTKTDRHIQSIKQSLDELEAALREHKQSQISQTPQSPRQSAKAM